MSYLRRTGWGPFPLPGEKRRMTELEADIEAAIETDRHRPDHGQAMANLAGLVAEALMHYDGLTESKAYGFSVSVANALNANPQVMRDVLDSQP